MTHVAAAFGRGQEHLDRALDRLGPDLAGLAVDASPRPGRAGRRGRPSSRAGRASGSRSASPTSQRDLREGRRGTSSPSTATRQRRARAPSMTSMPRSSAVGASRRARAVRDGLQVERLLPDVLGIGRRPAARRASASRPGRRSRPRRTGPARGPWRRRPASGSRCRRGHPTGRPSRSAGRRPGRRSWAMSRDVGPAASGSSQAAARLRRSVGPKREPAGRTRPVAQRELVGDRRTREGRAGQRRSGRRPTRPRREAAAAEGPSRRRAGGPGRTRRTGSCRPARAATGRRPRATASGSASPSAWSWLSTPPIDGSSSSSDPTPRATTIGYGVATAGHRRPDDAADGDRRAARAS